MSPNERALDAMAANIYGNGEYPPGHPAPELNSDFAQPTTGSGPVNHLPLSTLVAERGRDLLNQIIACNVQP